MKKYLAAIGLAVLLAASSAFAQQQTYYNINSLPVTCNSTATLVAGQQYRNAITVSVPTGGATTYVGAQGVTTSSGFPVVAGASLTLQPYSGPLYCVVSTGTQTLNVVETF